MVETKEIRLANGSTILVGDYREAQREALRSDDYSQLMVLVDPSCVRLQVRKAERAARKPKVYVKAGKR